MPRLRYRLGQQLQQRVLPGAIALLALGCSSITSLRPTIEETRPAQIVATDPEETSSEAEPASRFLSNPRPITDSDVRQIQAALPGEIWSADTSARVTLTGFGECLVVPVMTPPDKRGSALVVFLVQDGRVIYALPQPQHIPLAWSPLSPTEIGFMELNFDGGDSDIILISNYVAVGSTQSFPVVMVYLTAEDGTYNIDHQISEVLTERGVSTVEAAETIMRQEFYYLP